MEKLVRIIGGGLAGSEAAYQLARRGVAVELFEMRPRRMTEAHSSSDLGELVCSNSLRSNSLSAPAGLLKEEMRKLDSLVIRTAEATRVPAGSALAVDREDVRACIDRRRRSATERAGDPSRSSRNSSRRHHSGQRAADIGGSLTATGFAFR